MVLELHLLRLRSATSTPPSHVLIVISNGCRARNLLWTSTIQPFSDDKSPCRHWRCCLIDNTPTSYCHASTSNRPLLVCHPTSCKQTSSSVLDLFSFSCKLLDWPGPPAEGGSASWFQWQRDFGLPGTSSAQWMYKSDRHKSFDRFLHIFPQDG